MSTTKTALDAASDPVMDAYHDFKGSTENSTIPEAQKVLDTVHTARTNQWRTPGVDCRLGGLVPSVTAYLKGTPAEVPTVVNRIAERHELVEVERKHQHESGGLDAVVFVREVDVPE